MTSPRTGGHSCQETPAGPGLPKPQERHQETSMMPTHDPNQLPAGGELR